MFSFSREAVRVKVKKFDGSLPVEFRKFSVDPQITSFEVLQSILAKAFDLKNDFAVCYRMVDNFGNETFLPLLSDWDLDAAFIKAHNISIVMKSEPSLCLRVDLKPFEECCDDWEVRQPIAPYSPAKPLLPIQEIKPQAKLHGIINQVGKTINLMQRAFNFGEDYGSNPIMHLIHKAPLSDTEFRKYLDPVGQIVNAKELRSCIYYGGIEPSLRKVVWKHLLNVYPNGMTGRERMDYIKAKASEYYELKEVWKQAIAQGPVDGELAYTTGMVRKDVLRTDRHHEFYAGSDDNQNIASLFNILTTYALNHPKVSYCQGMSDLASPLLVTMNDEAHAYICFCALMERLCTNFMIDGIAMTQKFSHLSEAIMYYDSEFYNYLKMQQADDLLFCYRWLLLEMKREFAFEDSLRMLEVLWSSLPADPPDVELKLFDVKFQPVSVGATPPISPMVKTRRENAYTKVCALRRRSSSISLNALSNCKKLDKAKRLNQSLDEMMIKDRKVEVKLSHFNPDQKMKNCENVTECLESRARSLSPREENLSNNHVKNNKVRSSSLSSSMTNLMKSKKGEHFEGLKQKIISSKFFSSLDQLDSASSLETKPQSGGKMIKNFNEFLNFASVNKAKISNEIMRLGSVDGKAENLKVTLKSNMKVPSENSHTRHVSINRSIDDLFDDYSPDDQEYLPLRTPIICDLHLKMESLDRKVFSENKNSLEKKNDDVFLWENPLHKISPSSLNLALHSKNEDATPITIREESPSKTVAPTKESTPAKDTLEKKIDKVVPGDQTETVAPFETRDMTNSCEEVTEAAKSSTLPPPDEFGGGNPFLMFLSITVLLQHRDHIMDKSMDYNEMAMHFDKMIRRHNVISVLNQARQMYGSYMKQQSLILRNHKTQT